MTQGRAKIPRSGEDDYSAEIIADRQAFIEAQTGVSTDDSFARGTAAGRSDGLSDEPLIAGLGEQPVGDPGDSRRRLAEVAPVVWNIEVAVFHS